MRPQITLPTSSLPAESNYPSANILRLLKLTTTVLTPQSLSLRRCIAFQPVMRVATLRARIMASTGDFCLSDIQYDTTVNPPGAHLVEDVVNIFHPRLRVGTSDQTARRQLQRLS